LQDTGDGYDECDRWTDMTNESESFSPVGHVKHSKSKKKSAVNTVEAMNARRKKLWLHIAKKEIGKVGSS
jgi:hypothetical protein